MPEGGTYTLAFSLSTPVTVDVGALSEHRFPAGGYCYTGSALGSGGFSRIDRHRRVAAGGHEVRHWHVDYVGGHSQTELLAVERVAGEDRECVIARALGDGPVTRCWTSLPRCVRRARRPVGTVHSKRVVDTRLLRTRPRNRNRHASVGGA
jgi:endonuclease-3